MTNLRSDLPALPARFQRLPVDSRGYPVPWFVAWVDGKPDFRVADSQKLSRCVKEDRCWLCGDLLGAFRASVIGPMCIINRISSEPPSHRECAEFAAKACPFLTRPMAKRNERNLPSDHQDAAGFGLKRNPGVTAVWVNKRPGYKIIRAYAGAPGVLFQLSEPTEVLWYAEGRTASRAEIMASIESGYPLLLEPATEEGPEAVAALTAMVAAAQRLLPAEAA